MVLIRPVSLADLDQLIGLAEQAGVGENRQALDLVEGIDDDAPDAGQVPPDVARLIAELGLPEKRWSLLDPDERFALAKMARGGADKFMSAWSEFADKR